MSKTDQNKSKMPNEQDTDEAHRLEVDNDRREALRKMGQCAAYVAPAMLVLMNGTDAKAHHKPWHTGGPPCNNPGQGLGINRNGHSGC